MKIALTNIPDAIFSRKSIASLELIISTIPISSINPATIPKWSIFLICVFSMVDIFHPEIFSAF